MIETALASSATGVLVVLGQRKDKIIPVIERLPVSVVHNKNWEKTQLNLPTVEFLSQQISWVIFVVLNKKAASLLPSIVPNHSQTRSIKVVCAYAVNNTTNRGIFSD